MILTERDDFLLTMYHADHIRFAAFCDEDDCTRVDELNDTLTDKQISEAIERYNQRTFGVTHKECKQGKCLTCKDISICVKRGGDSPLRSELK